MEIIIQDKEAFKHYLADRNILWEIYFKRVLKAFVLRCFLAIIFFVIANSPSQQSSETEYNIYLIIAIIYTALITITFLSVIRSKSKFMAEASRVGTISFGQINEAMTRMNDESVYFKTPVWTMEFKWAIFANYSLYKDYLILSIGQMGMNAVVIDKTIMPEASFRELMSFVSSKIKEKKIYTNPLQMFSN
jgi:hypothetical protein